MEILDEINVYSSCSSVPAFVIASATLQFFTNMNLNYFTGDINSFTSGKRSEKIHFRICRYLKRQFILGMGKNHWWAYLVHKIPITQF